MRKKTISAIIVLVLLMSFTLTALAAETPATPTDQPQSPADTMFGREKARKNITLGRVLL